MSTARPHYPMGSTTETSVRGIRLARTQAKMDSITSVTANIRDANDNIVSGSSIALEADGVYDDLYWGRFPHTVTLTRGARIEIEVVVTGLANGATIVRRSREPFYAEYAGFRDE